MASLYNLKPEKVIKAFERAGWVNEGQVLKCKKCGQMRIVIDDLGEFLNFISNCFQEFCR